MIEVNHLCKYFSRPYREPGLKGAVKSLFTPKKVVTKAVDDISFTVNDGEIVGYIGANGAGKSTTIKMMTGILTPTSGEILIDGKKPYDSRDRKTILQDIGVVFGQRTQLWWDLPVRDSFDLVRDIYDIPSDVYEKRLAYLDGILGLKPFMMSQVRTLSLGQRMRADLAAALLHEPKILFLDEPTIGLDVLVKEKMTDAIRQINKDKKTTIILTTHDMKDIQNLCQRIVIIDEGHLLYDGTLKDIKKRFGDIRHVYVLSKDTLDNEAAIAFFKGNISIQKLDDGYLEVSYDADKLEPKEILNYLLSHLDVKDIRIDETTLSSIVRKIYATKSI
ncbi:MAG: putative ABC transporter ATP-binding protein YbhF [Tenericutes bacterium ADurb.BinA155]|nr:MAG: putative ABC transporter ATP-binding protein YbhF [Tenericutes bacterium ADurb.BinA155]